MPTLGSATNPTFAGWQWVGTAGYAFAGLYTVPGTSDILITDIAAYFDTFAGSGANGYLMIWDGDDSIGNPVLYASAPFIINNGSKSAGGQQWWSKSGVNLQVAGGKSLWIGGYCDQGIIWSTYDTSPHTFYKAMGSPLPGSTFFNSPFRTDSGQGPPGAYVTYSTIVKGSVTMADVDGGLAAVKTKNTVTPAAFKVGMRTQSGLRATGILYNAVANMVGNNGGGMSITTNVVQPKIWVWRSL